MLSFIIPVYNAEKYILNCINKILQISCSDFEIIVVNDGSTDRTGEILKEIIDRRICVLNQKNLGVSAARNLGIAHAKGDYLMFIDADDFMIPQQMDLIIDSITGSSDLYMFAYEEERGEQVRKIPLPVQPGCYLDKAQLSELGDRLLDMKFARKYVSKYFGGKVYQYFFSREFLQRHNIIFCQGIHFAEDCLFCLSCFKHADSMTVLDITGYHYIVYDDSASHRYRDNFWNELKDFYRCVCEIEKPDLQTKGKFLFYYGNDVIKRSMIHFPQIKDRKRVWRNIAQVINDEDFYTSVKTMKFDKWSLKEKVFRKLCLRKKSSSVYWWLFFCNKVISLKHGLKCVRKGT